jgi:hypothetical protein
MHNATIYGVDQVGEAIIRTRPFGPARLSALRACLPMRSGSEPFAVRAHSLFAMAPHLVIMAQGPHPAHAAPPA